MRRRELHHTLLEAIEGLAPSTGTGLTVTEASIDLPLELVAVDRGGVPVVAGSAPHSRWETGFLPPVHLAHLEIGLLDHLPATSRRRDGG